ncbi:hypothetical protein [Streptomyces griseiscabiei]|uniref:Uncharacterized protein n=1 Tax=Streptomyces griseiscabiei TaxID=2993540 RepID=A0ABU4KXR3_9ACTN|nr:hypothetical protein [Streptomyces griseiscabiei]MBZ3904433.1 hypothetical protein [Streptomyces griseiscabiei]MDX2908181.1 hypothetical protein [Streptomyces griseiscabiei]
MARLSEALAPSHAAFDTWRRSNLPVSVQPAARVQPPKEVRVRLGLEAVPAIETWLTERDSFVRIARAAEPAGPTRALPGTTLASAPPPCDAHPSLRLHAGDP